MKKILFSTTLTAFGLGSFAQTFVSTSPENRNAVLEEFTGIYCTYCPDGHKRAQEFHDANPGDVVLVNIHTGGYANPDPGDPDFRTNYGSALANQSGLCGYPAGTINRQYFPNYFQVDQNNAPCGTDPTAQSRGTWATTGAMVLGESSPVNVAGQATIDLTTGKLTVVVEAYYTGDAVNSTNMLTVAVMQNNVEGPQTGSGANPAQVLPNGNYNHNHMLRHFMTGQWGADVTPTTTGSFFTDTYTWDLPADINDVPLDPGNLEVAVYIAEDHQNIITGSMATLSVVSPNTYDALPAEIDIPDYVCDNEIAPKVLIQNMGNETLTSLEIQYNVNGGATQVYNWMGSLETAQTEVVTLPTVSFTHLSENTLWVGTSSPNGQLDEVASNNNAWATFEPTKNSGTTVDITIVTDNYGYETYWEIQDPSGTVVASGGNTNVGINGGGGQSAAAGDPGAYGNNATVNETVTLSSTGCHTFYIVDDWGDGICCTYGNGSFTIESNGSELYDGGQFAAGDDRTFNVGGTSGVEDIELVNSLSVYPNPFQENTRISFNMTQSSEVILEVVNVLGAKVRSENLGELAAGIHNMNLSSGNLDAGIYLVNLSVGGNLYSTRVSITK